MQPNSAPLTADERATIEARLARGEHWPDWLTDEEVLALHTSGKFNLIPVIESIATILGYEITVGADQHTAESAVEKS
jgi:hypothetical protein